MRDLLRRFGPWVLIPCGLIEATVWRVPTEAVFLASLALGDVAAVVAIAMVGIGVGVGASISWHTGAAISVAGSIPYWPGDTYRHITRIRTAYHTDPWFNLAQSGILSVPIKAWALVGGAIGVPQSTVVPGLVLGQVLKYVVVAVVTRVALRSMQRAT